jgi:hypothetical protein
MQGDQQHSIRITNGPIQGAITVLVMLTAIIHLFLFFSEGMLTEALSVLFLLNGTGYLVQLAALYMPRCAAFQPPTRWLLTIYTALTIIIWIILKHAAFDPFDYLDKLIEISLITLLIIEGRQAISHQSHQSHQATTSTKQSYSRMMPTMKPGDEV